MTPVSLRQTFFTKFQSRAPVSSQEFENSNPWDVLNPFACGHFQGCHYAMWTLTRGYMENDCTFHVDTHFSYNLLFRFPTDLFRKTFVCEFHLEHPMTSTQGSHHTRFVDGSPRWRSSFTGDGFEARRNWGCATDARLPAVLW
jgi:hypothetical protein